jgi:hypothetical protein
MTIIAGTLYTTVGVNGSAHDHACDGSFVRRFSHNDLWRRAGRLFGARGVGPFWLRLPRLAGYSICIADDPLAPNPVPPFFTPQSPPPGIR